MSIFREKAQISIERLIEKPMKRILSTEFEPIVEKLSTIIDKVDKTNSEKGQADNDINFDNPILENEILKKQIANLDISFEKVLEIVDLARPFTLIPDNSQYFNIVTTVKAIRDCQNGVIVECGTWKGGSSLTMLLAQREFFGKVIKPVYMLDSFEGLPLAKEIDGKLATAWQSDKLSPAYTDNCTACVEDVIAMLNRFGFKEGEYFIVKGWFENTLPSLREELKDKKIAILRLDGDWYESTKVCLDYLEPLVEYGSSVIIDDYFAWDGCAVAVNEYLGVHKLPYRIRTIANHMGAYFKKKCRDNPNEL